RERSARRAWPAACRRDRRWSLRTRLFWRMRSRDGARWTDRSRVASGSVAASGSHALRAVQDKADAEAIALVGAAHRAGFGPGLTGTIEDGDEHAGLNGAAGVQADAFLAGVDHFNRGEPGTAAAVGVDGARDAAGCFALEAAALEGN